MDLLVLLFVITMIFFFLLFLGGSILLLLSNPWAWAGIIVISLLVFVDRRIRRN